MEWHHKEPPGTSRNLQAAVCTIFGIYGFYLLKSQPVTMNECSYSTCSRFNASAKLTALGLGVAAVALEVGVAAELHWEFGRDIRGIQG